MSKEACIIKGTKHGLSILIPSELAFSEVLAQLRARLASAQEFFAGATVYVSTTDRELKPEEKQQLAQTVEAFGMVISEREVPEQSASAAEHKAGTMGEANEPAEDTLLVRRTIRSGQRIWYNGNVVVLGDVNPGAEIVCTGDILVLGCLRGVAHAGCNGNVNASVFAFRLEPTQLRIASYISRSPDEKLPRPLEPEIARICENVIQISAYQSS
ncbi:MAG: septum site-determining protein MinC [Firmicutes bacterium]|nr:septum site-determining protein MinC [Bacillota bacterium]NLL88317.1 septum site-determining protein MinC [Bacillota bacterium]